MILKYVSFRLINEISTKYNKNLVPKQFFLNRHGRIKNNLDIYSIRKKKKKKTNIKLLRGNFKPVLYQGTILVYPNLRENFSLKIYSQNNVYNYQRIFVLIYKLRQIHINIC